MSTKPPVTARPRGKPVAEKKRDPKGPKRAGQGEKVKRGDKPRKSRKLCAKHAARDRKRKKKAKKAA